VINGEQTCLPERAYGLRSRVDNQDNPVAKNTVNARQIFFDAAAELIYI
jgi:hypothetical protein